MWCEKYHTTHHKIIFRKSSGVILICKLNTVAPILTLKQLIHFPRQKKKRKRKTQTKKSPTKAKLRTNLCPSPRGPYMMSVDPAGGSHTQLPYKTHD